MAGTERFILETTDEMLSRGIDSRVYTTSVSNDLLANVSNHVEIEKSALITTPLFHLYSDLAISKRLIDAASSWADAIILHHGIGVAGYAGNKYGVSCVPFFHSDKYDTSLYGVLKWLAPAYTYPLKILESKSIRSIPLAFANSRSLGNKVKCRTKCTKVTTIPLGVDVDRFRPKWVDEGFILMVGRFHPINNFELGMAAASKALCRVIVAGVPEQRFERYFQHLQRLVKASPELRNRVEFLLPQNDDELISLIQCCSVFLSPRKYDYLGLAALEAMSCGKPVIAYNIDEEEGPKSVVRCGDNRLAWQETLTTLMNDNNLRQAIGRESRAFVEQNHTWKRTVDVMLDSIKTIIR